MAIRSILQRACGLNFVSPSKLLRFLAAGTGVSPGFSLGNQEVLGEGPCGVEPLGFATEADAGGHFGDFFGFVLVGAFGPDGFVFVEDDA